MTTTEVERKRALPGSGETVTARLIELSYRTAGATIEVDTYYGRPDVDYMETKQCLRVRRRDGFAEVTYKPESNAGTHSDSDVIAKQETNLILAGADQEDNARRLLEAIGMIYLARVEKDRVSYRHPEHADTIVSIDTITGVGTFVEVEVNTADTGNANARLDDVERQLGLTEYPTVSLPYRDLVLQHQATGLTMAPVP